MKHININVGNNTLQVERGISVQELIDCMERNNWNPADWIITYVFPEEGTVEPVVDLIYLNEVE